MDPISTAVELHRALQAKGIELSRNGDRRDDQLLTQLAAELGLPVDDFTPSLERSGKSAEEYLRVFIRLAGAFAQMYKEIWTFMCSWHAPQAGENLRIKFGLDGDATELNWDEFRESVQKLSNAVLSYKIPIWPYHALFEFIRRAKMSYNERGRIEYRRGDRPRLPVLAGDSAVEVLVNEFVNIVQVWIDEVYAKGTSEEPFVNPYNDLAGKSPDIYRVHTWRDLAHVLTDVVPMLSMLVANWNSVSEVGKRSMLEYYRTAIEPMIIHVDRDVHVQVHELLDVLNLPFWKHRWHTYEIWCTVMALQALGEHRPQPVIQDNSLGLDASSNRLIARLDTKPQLYVQLQPQYALTAPIAVNRGTEVHNRLEVRPDLRIGIDDPATLQGSIALIEFKQRGVLTTTHIQEVLQVYGAGTGMPNGCVIIANYDAVPAIKLAANSEYLIGHMRPGMPQQVTAYQEAIRRAVPRQARGLVLLDASSSMGAAYSSVRAQEGLRTLKQLDRIKVYLFGSSLREAGDILDLQNNATDHMTDLIGALQGLGQRHAEDTITKTLIVSDGGYETPNDLSGFGDVRECTPDELLDALEDGFFVSLNGR